VKSLYNRVAAGGLERIAALSDGLFAIAMTLIVLEIHVPAPASVRSDGELWHALAALGPRLVTYALSFMTLGIFWVGQQTQLNFLARADRELSWCHLAFLAAVAMMPFSTELLAEFMAFRAALLVYWLNLFVLGAVLFATWRYAARAGLVKPDAPPGIHRAIERRIVIAQTLYAFGAALSFFGTSWSIAFIICVQLYFAIAPRMPGSRALETTATP
jgi:uncharacterized membrane protein